MTYNAKLAAVVFAFLLWLSGCDDPPLRSASAVANKPPLPLDVTDCLIVTPSGTAADLRAIESFEWHFFGKRRDAFVRFSSGGRELLDLEQGQQDAFMAAWKGCRK
jgi:hypothetical protein